ncbi:MAG: hypothetical protein AAGI07_03355 [Bacteroidota bacterium]
MKISFLIYFLLTLIACQTVKKEEEKQKVEFVSTEIDLPQEAISFSGKPLYRKAIDEATLKKTDSIIQSLQQKPELLEEDYIALGSHYIATNRFRDAIAVYTKGLASYPTSFKLLRHRGHRFINVRELENAIVDLSKANDLIGDENEKILEYDAKGKPTGSYQYWIWYHIGLYHLLNEEYKKAAEAYNTCLSLAMNGKNNVGVSAWLYTVYQKMGESELAKRAIETITKDYDTDREHPYFKRVMLYKGNLKPQDILNVNKPVEQWTARDITIAYGVADWYSHQQDTNVAEGIYEKILQTPHWNAWAYVVTDKIVAE